MRPAMGFHGSFAMAARRRVRGQPRPEWQASVSGGTFRRDDSVSARSHHQRSGPCNHIHSPVLLRRSFGSSPPRRRDNDKEEFWRHILAWNPDHTGALAPHHPKLAESLDPTERIPTKFRDMTHYMRTMLPLFLQELWEQIRTNVAADEPLSYERSGSFNLVGQAYHDGFVELEVRFHRDSWMDPRPNTSNLLVLRGLDSTPIFAQVHKCSNPNDGRRGNPQVLHLRVSPVTYQPEWTGESKLFGYTT